METISRCLLTFLLNSLWQIPLVAAVAALGCRLMRNGPASHRHAVWVAALAACALLPLASVRVNENPSNTLRVPDRPVTVSAVPLDAASATPAAARPSSESRSRTVPLARTTAEVLLAGYLLFLAFRLARLLAACLRTMEIRRGATPADPSPLAAAVWKRAEAAFGLRAVELLSSPSV